ncbi:MAG: arsenite methyltransferase [Acidobacteriota bacterium]
MTEEKTLKPSYCAGSPVTEIVANDKDAVRAQVTEAYANAITLSVKEGGNACCSNTLPAGIAAQTAGYSECEAAEYSEAAQSSFGCGNPMAFAGVKEGQTVLDLGSGAGFDLLLASRKVGPEGRVIGVDMTDAMIEVARDNIRQAGADNIEVRKGMIEELPIEDSSVDWVISNCVINLSPQKDRVFSEISRVLRSGGNFSVSDIVAEDLPDDLRQLATAYSACIGGALSETQYLAGLATAGLDELEVTERLVYDEAQIRAMVGGDLAALGVPADLLDAQLGRVVGKVWSAKITGRKS